MGYSSMVSAWAYKDPDLFSKRLQLASNDDWLKNNGWQDSVQTVFFQAAAPTGWTKIVTQNDKALRVVSGAGGGSGGTTALSSTITLAHTHTVQAGGVHTHTMPAHGHAINRTSTGSLGAVTAEIVNKTSGSSLFVMSAIGASTFNTVKSYTDTDGGGGNTGSDADHNHGGTTGSSLSDIAFAYIDVIVCSKDTSSGYTDLTTTFKPHRLITWNDLDSLAENDKFLYDRLMPSTSVSIFCQVAAPTGWTKLTTQDDKALRIVSGAGGGAGGTKGLSTVITLAHANSITARATHLHSMADHRHVLAKVSNSSMYDSEAELVSNNGTNLIGLLQGVGAISKVTDRTDNIGSAYNTSSDDAHDHGGTVVSALNDVTLAYLDVIQASKDAAGSSSSYTDLSAEFDDQELLTYQLMNELGANDFYIKYHTPPATTVMLFFQASAPLTWTKLATQNDKALRIVSGVTGGSAGGTAALSSTITLAHIHTVTADPNHTHTIANHTHTNEISANTLLAGVQHYVTVGSVGSGDGLRACDTAGAITQNVADDDFNSAINSGTATTGTGGTHTHTIVTALTDVSLAYVDVIQAQKN